jgi:protein-S-isoprenylcysteine O-methyltransferase Ste14
MRFLTTPLALFVVCLGAMLLLGSVWPVARLLHSPWTYGGGVLVLAGLFFCGGGALRIVRKRTTLEPFGEPTCLIASGVFRYSRHPIYLGFALILTGAWVLAGVVSAGLPVLAFVVVVDRFYIRFEEKTLARKFGPDYDKYRRKTRRWI